MTTNPSNRLLDGGIMGNFPVRTVGQMIKRAREHKDMTQKELGRLLGLRHGNFIGLIESGHSVVPYYRIPRLCSLLDLDPVDLFRRVMSERDPEMARCLWER
jgi:transcriptional regulator with XRE-family HTH domain